MPKSLRALLPTGSIGLLALLVFATSLFGAPLTPGNLVIYRVGNGAAALGATGTAVFLDEYTPAGALVQSIPLPTTTVGANRRLVASGSATTEGQLTRSVDGSYLVLAGYDAALGAAAVSGTTSATVNRVIARLDSSGVINTTTALTDASSGSNPRGVAATNGTDFWISGGAGGVRYTTLGGTTSTQISATLTNLRAVAIFGGQLYISTQSGAAIRVGTVGTGIPTTSGQTIANLPGFSTTSAPNAFFLADLSAGVPGVDTLYVADETAGQILKYSLVAGTWTSNGTITATSVRGLTATVSGSTVTLYLTYSVGSKLASVVDTSGYNAAPSTTTVTDRATAAANTAFRGVALAPVSPLPNLSVDDVSLNEGNAGTTSFTFTVSLLTPAGPGGVTFDIATADNTATQPGDYTLKSLTAQTIPSGSSTYSFTVLVNGDTTPETNETFFVNVANVTGATVTDGQGQGTIVNDDAAPNLTITDVSLNEGNAGTTTFTFTVNLSAPAGTGGVTFDIATANSSAVAPGDFTAKTLTGQTIPAGSSTYTFDVLVNGDTTPESDEIFFVNVTNAVNAIVTDGQGQGTIVNDDLTFIHDVQGSGATTPIPAITVTVQGVVIANFQGTDKLRGFFLEEEDVDQDANPATSEGIFIFCSTCPTAVAEGQQVRVTGSVSENFNLTEITASTAGSVVITDAGNHLAEVTPSPIDLPVAGVVDDFYEARESMLVNFVDTLTVSEYFELARFGHLELFEGGRPRQFTEANPPSVAGYTAHLDNLDRRRVILDDDDNGQESFLTLPNGSQYVFYPTASGGFSTGTQGVDFFRGGDLVSGLTGVLEWDFPGFGPDTWRIRPTAAHPVTFTVANPRPATPPAVGGAIKAAGMNLLNYFTTIDTTASNSTGPCGPSATLDCRGADSVAELNRQRERASIVICTLNADVFAFMELENTTPSATITDLLGAVNARCGGAHPYDFANTGGTLGTDAIRVQFIYRTGILSPVGSPLVDLDPVHNRPPTAQTFDVVDAANPAFGQRFTVIANHFKSKGGCPGSGADADAGDGAACFNATRTAQATRLLTWISGTVVPAAGDPDVLLLGDFNSYPQETPVTTLTGGGYTDLETYFHGAAAYSYLFDAQLGHLDYGFANASLLSQVTGADAWHINADEAALFDYNDEVFDSPGEASFDEKPDGSALAPPRVVFQPASPYRASDHDPVLVGLFLVADLAVAKVDTPDPVAAGTSLTYTITVTNNGPDAAATAAWSDTLPAGTAFVSLPAVAGWSCTTPSVGAGGTVSCSNPSFAAGSAVFTLTVAVDPSVAAGTVLTNTATATSATAEGKPGDESDTATTTVAALADLSLLKTGTPDTVAPGGDITYTIAANNEGPSTATSVSLSDSLPVGTTFQSIITPAGWGCSTPAVGANGTVTCTAATFPAGSAVFTLVVRVGGSVTDGTVLGNTVTVSSATADPNPGNESATSFTTVGSTIAGLTLAITDTPDPVTAGFDVTYTVTVSATFSDGMNAVLSLPMPPGTTFQSLVAPGGWSCTAPAVGAAGTASCSAATLAAGNTVFDLTVHVPSSAVAGSTVTDTASFVVETNGRVVVASDMEGTLVAAPTVLSATKTAAGQLVPNGTVTYTIVLSNAGPGAQGDNPGDELTDVLPPELTLVSASATSGTAVATVATNTVTWNGALAAGSSVTITIQATIATGLPSPVTISNQASFSYDANGDGVNESSGVSDDPAAAGSGDPTDIVLAAVIDIPALDVLGLALLTALLAAVAARRLRRA